MNPPRHTLALLLSCAALAAGCAASDGENVYDGEDLDVPLDTAGYGGTKEPPAGTNGLLPLPFWHPISQLGLRELGKYPLGSGGTYTTPTGTTMLKLPSTTLPSVQALAATYPEVLKYVLQCALRSTDKVYDPVSGNVYSGWWGLAPEWLTISGGIWGRTNAQMWVTACMIERLNPGGFHVDLLLEGDTPPIQVNTTYNSLFRFGESTVFGNLFNSTMTPGPNSPAFYAYLCREDYLALVCTDGGKNYIDKRLCDNDPGTCGIVDIGKCSTAAPAGNCSASGEHWQCKTPGGSTYFVPTIGVQLYDPITPTQCN